MPKIEVTFKIEETVVTDVTTTLELDTEAEAAELLADPVALMDRLSENADEPEWVDDIDPATGAVNERDVIEIVSATRTKED